MRVSGTTGASPDSLNRILRAASRTKLPLWLGGDEQQRSNDARRLLNLARELQQGIEPFPASHGDIYRVRAMDVNTPVDNFDAVIASHGSSLLAKI